MMRVGRRKERKGKKDVMMATRMVIYTSHTSLRELG